MIKVNSLTKDYYLLENASFWKILNDKKKFDFYRALDNVSFEAKKGEVIGIIGDNGAGKSTLLKILTGVTYPTIGTVTINGRFSAILEVSTGFNNFLTGRQNIRQRLMLQGNSRAVIHELEPEIIDFSELSDVIDDPVMTYSTGMAARLAFAIVTAAVNDVLFVDELLVVGDEHFQGKCFHRIKKICSSGKTVVIASHNISFVERLCDRAIWLEQGKIRLDGSAHTVGMAYYGKDKGNGEISYPREYGCIKSVIPEISDSRMAIHITIDLLKQCKDLYVQIAVHDNRLGILCCLLNSAWQGKFLPDKFGLHELTVEFDLPEGLQKGLIALVLKRGSGTIHNDIIEDNWGWDLGKQVYFSKPTLKENTGYIHRMLNWQYVHQN